MEETVVTKRPREASQVEEQEVDSHEEQCKRHKPYNHILSLLESEEEEPTEDLSSLITTLQQEITCSASHSETHLSPLQENNRDNYPTATATATATAEEDDKERVMRHLLQASDDELGIPNAGDGLWDFGEERLMNGGDNGLGYVCEGLWELEDETANYYALLQSELFL